MWSVVAFHFPCTIARDPSISKYCVSRGDGASASANVGTRLAPCTGCWPMPSTTVGQGIPAASSTVADRSTAWQNCGRTSPCAAMPFGQCTISGVRMPPSHV
jgi:hypothetical protein